MLGDLKGTALLRYVVGDAVKNILFYGLVAFVAVSVAPHVWILGAGFFAFYAILVGLDVVVHAGVILTTPVVLFDRRQAVPDRVFDAIAGVVRALESVVLVWAGYEAYQRIF